MNPALFSGAAMHNLAAVKAAAISEDITETTPSKSVTQAMSDANYMMKSADEANEQQTEESSFLNASDLLNGLLLGAGAALTGGLSLAGGTGIGLLGAYSSGSGRRAEARAEELGKEAQAVSTGLDLLGQQSSERMVELQMQNSGLNDSGVVTGNRLDNMARELALNGTEEEYTTWVEENKDKYPNFPFYTYQQANAIARTNLMTGSSGQLFKQVQRLVEGGMTQDAASLVGSTLAPMLSPYEKPLLDPDTPELTNIWLQHVYANSTLTDTQRELFGQMGITIRRNTPEAYDEFVQSLRYIDTSPQLVFKETLSRLQAAVQTSGDIKGFKELFDQIQALVDMTSDPNTMIWSDATVLDGLLASLHRLMPVYNRVTQNFPGVGEPAPGAGNGLSSPGSSGRTSSYRLLTATEVETVASYNDEDLAWKVPAEEAAQALAQAVSENPILGRNIQQGRFQLVIPMIQGLDVNVDQLLHSGPPEAINYMLTLAMEGMGSGGTAESSSRE